MTANDDTPSMGKEPAERNDYEPQADGGMARRVFLGAAAAVSVLPVVGGTASAQEGAEAADSPDTEVHSGEHGSEHTTVESGDAVFGTVQVHEMLDEETKITVHGYSYDDEPGEVECDISVNGAGVTLGFGPDRARKLAEELTIAADAAERGGE